MRCMEFGPLQLVALVVPAFLAPALDGPYVGN
jgi:hypothetical protein